MLMLFLGKAQSQDVMMQAWYWDFFNQNNSGLSWAKHLENRANDLKEAGITYMWMPPTNRTSTSNDMSNGYNPKDLFDYGSPINGINRPTSVGSRTELDQMIAAFNSKGIKTVADMVYNHRDGGALEVNPAVKYYMNNMTSSKSPFPCDRFVIALPLGAMNPGQNGAGDYYFKFSSATGLYGSNHRYNIYMRTNKITASFATYDEVEPNGGGDCGQTFNTIKLRQNVRGYLGNDNNCLTDEFKITLTAADIKDSGLTRDTLWIHIGALEGGYSDFRPYGVWSAARNTNIVNELLYMTNTNYNNLPSGQGGMNFEHFRPNTASQATENLQGDENHMYFYYDYDHSNSSVRNILKDWTRWNWSDVGMRGFRIDAVKHFPAWYMGEILNDLHANNMNPGMVVGEHYDGNPYNLKAWVDAVNSSMTTSAKAAIKPRLFDFALRGALRDACDTYGYDVRNVFSSGMVHGAGTNSDYVVTFINNHDFRNASGWSAAIQNDPMLAYAYILTNNKIGIPCLYYPDYYGVARPNAPTVNLKSQIDTLIGLHQKHIFGASQIEYLNQEGSFYQGLTGGYISGSKSNCLIYQVKGGASGKDVIVAINFSGASLKVNHNINTSGNPAGTRFYDMLKRSAHPFAVVDGSGKIYIDLPARSYSVWVKDNPAQLQAKINLQHFNTSSGLMEDFLRTDASFPLSDPYATAPHNVNFVHKNNGATATTTAQVLAQTGNNAIVDWVFVELRVGPSNATSVAYTKAGLLQRDGDIVATDGVSPLTFEALSGSYYVTIRHRNHLGVRTLQPVTFNGTAPVSLNFSSNSVAVNGNQAFIQLSSNAWGLAGGDANSDGSIDSFDSITWELENGLFLNPYTLNSDYNLDGSVDAFDSIIWDLSNGRFEEF